MAKNHVCVIRLFYGFKNGEKFDLGCPPPLLILDLHFSPTFYMIQSTPERPRIAMRHPWDSTPGRPRGKAKKGNGRSRNHLMDPPQGPPGVQHGTKANIAPEYPKPSQKRGKTCTPRPTSAEPPGTPPGNYQIVAYLEKNTSPRYTPGGLFFWGYPG